MIDLRGHRGIGLGCLRQSFKARNQNNDRSFLVDLHQKMVFSVGVLKGQKNISRAF